MRYLDEIRENERVIEHYLCKQKQALKTKTGKTYYSLKLQDKTAVVDAKVWELNSDIAEFEEFDIIKIDGIALMYQGVVQIKINRIRKSIEGEYEPSEFIPSTDKDVDEMHGQLLDYIDSVGNPPLKQLLQRIIIEHEGISAAIKSHSAAKNMHHSYLGGLLEHTVAVVGICDFMSKQYPHVDRDLLITAAILHDIAKVFELTPMPSNLYTDDGQLLGHIYLGAELINQEAAHIPDFPAGLQSLLKHAILAHHGEYAFGSPKLPATTEAYILHCADNMDAKIKTYQENLDSDATPGLWTGYNKMLERYLRKSVY